LAKTPDQTRSRSESEDDSGFDRLRALTKHIPGDSAMMEQEIFKLDASTEEEVDALRVNLLQDDGRPASRDGSGRVVDEVAEESLGRFTEVGPGVGDRGAESVVPGREDTSRVLRRHHPNTEIARAEDVVEGNLDEPREESRGERKVDEGTAG
jgi:hypothetical protein